jgi:hypothetical protein
VNNAQLIEAFKTMGLDAQLDQRVSGVLFKGYRIPIGRHAGEVVDVAVAIDYPCTPPVGVHVHAPYGAVGQNNVSASALGGDWRYYSRRYAEWRADRSPRSVVAYVNKILGDV